MQVKEIRSFTSQGLINQINGDHTIKRVVAILRDGGEFCAIVEVEEIKKKNKDKNVRNTGN